MAQKHQKHKRAFTLVEVLIVIIIIGILAGLIMLSSGSATDSADRTRCVADRRSLRSALYIFRVEGEKPVSADLSAVIKEVLDKMFDNGQGTVSGDSEIDGICPSKGIYTVTVSDDKYLIACSIHGGDSGSGTGGTGGDSGDDGGGIIDKIFGDLVNSACDKILANNYINAAQDQIFTHEDSYYVVSGKVTGFWEGSYVEPDAAGKKWNTISNGGIVKVTGVVVDINSMSTGQTFKRGDIVRMNDGSYYICHAAPDKILSHAELPESTISKDSWYKLPQSQ
ncbi:MAG: prepilin-type N-terminal cleavage/methylation domain-containing protein [Synergistaceae bacterium]|nr:prepilin-type N-terminal cleavage/methylation domain-containing protein [Synergistaceae bacterium]